MGNTTKEKKENAESSRLNEGSVNVIQISEEEFVELMMDFDDLMLDKYIAVYTEDGIVSEVKFSRNLGNLIRVMHQKYEKKRFDPEVDDAAIYSIKMDLSEREVGTSSDKVYSFPEYVYDDLEQRGLKNLSYSSCIKDRVYNDSGNPVPYKDIFDYKNKHSVETHEAMAHFDNITTIETFLIFETEDREKAIRYKLDKGEYKFFETDEESLDDIVINGINVDFI